MGMIVISLDEFLERHWDELIRTMRELVEVYDCEKEKKEG